ncbi:MAG: hypothetical protein IJW86_00830 [Clostridia bacterium]|nr:hypothetical protein [Clostridia bacterium]
MTKKINAFLLIIVCLMCFTFFASAVKEDDTYYPPENVLCIAYRGDTALYKQNSKEAVLSAYEKGADFVSVNIRKADSGELVLCSENATEVKGTTLKEMLTLIDEGSVLILDFDSALKDEVYNLIKGENALSRAWLRIKDSEKNINNWVSSKEKEPTVIGVCSSFNIFTVQSFVEKLRHMPAVQLQSKNYFNVMYGAYCYSYYDSRVGTRAIAPMYNPDLCGQRSDSEDGWNDLIKKNFSIIETNNLDAFITYRDNACVLKEKLSLLLEKAKAIDPENYSLVSKENLADSIDRAKILVVGGMASCDELQSAHSALQLSINNLTLSEGEDTQKGALNITTGKVIAAVLVGALILAAQIYVHKMQKEKKR